MENGSCCAGNTKTEKTGCGTGGGTGGGKCACGKTGCDGGCCNKEKSGCAAKLVRGSFLGGITLFAILAFSWMVLPFHKTSAGVFKDPVAVAEVLSAQTEGGGLYAMPSFGAAPATTEGQPFAFVVWSNDSFRLSLPLQMGLDLAVCFVAALLLTMLLKKQSCGCQIMFSMKAGLLAGLMGYMPAMIWFHFPLKYTALGIADLAIAFALAGFVISRFALKSGGACAAGK